MLSQSRISSLVSVLVLLLPFCVYTFTAAPMVTAGDAGELVAALFSLGVPHPPGYPFLTMTGKAAALLPVGDVAFRANVLSGFFVSISVYLSYLAMSELASASRPVLFGSMALAAAFSSTVWGIATEAEAYSGSLALVTASIYLALRWRNGNGARYIYSSAFMAGLAVCGHYSALVALPGLAVLVLVTVSAGGRFRLIAGCAGFFAFGLSLFMALPVRASTHPQINWGHTDGFRALLAHLIRAKYGDLGRFTKSSAPSLVEQLSGAWVPLALGLLVAAVVFAVAWRLLRKRGLPAAAILLTVATLAGLVALTVKGYNPIKPEYFVSIAGGDAWWGVLALSAAGLYGLYRRDRGLFLPVLLIAVCMSMVFIHRIPTNPREYMLPISDKFFAPWSIFTAILAGAGLDFIARPGAGKVGRAGMAAYAASVLALAFAGWLFYSNLVPSDRHEVFWPHDYARDMDRTIEPGSLYLTEGDHHPFFSIYLKVVENSLEGVEILELNENIFKSYQRLEEIVRYGRLDVVYCSQEAELDPFPGIDIVQTGILNRWVLHSEEVLDPVGYYVFRADPRTALESGFMNRSIYANYTYHMGRRLANMGRDREAVKYFDDALYVGDIFPWLLMNVGNFESSWGLTDRALERYNKVLDLAPANFVSYLNIGDIRLKRGDLDGARAAFLDATSAGDGRFDPFAFRRLAEISEVQGRPEEAAMYWREYAKKPGADPELARQKAGVGAGG